MRRVTSRTFILITLLGPALFIGFFIAVGLIAISSVEDGPNGDSVRRIAIVDDTGVLSDLLLRQDIGADSLFVGELETVREGILSGQIDAYIHLSEEVIHGTRQPILYYRDGNRIGDLGILERSIGETVKEYLLSEENISDDVSAILDRLVFFDTITLDQDQQESFGNAADDEIIYFLIGLILGTIMFIGIMIYGSSILYGVIEERTSRVVEVIVSSVRPFDLLMGKVLGIGLVGFVQITTWMIMIIGGMILTSAVMDVFTDPMIYELESTTDTQQILSSINSYLPSISAWMIVWFIIYFIGGYLLYGALFAAIGSLVDSPQESQTLLVPVMMPLLLSIVFLSPILLNPSSNLAVGLSLFPMTSPVPMVVRLALGAVPVWQILLSYGLLILTFIGSISMSAKIYRSSILTYHKKVSFKRIFGYLKSG